MKTLKQIAFCSLLAVGGFSALTFTSCKKDDNSCAVGFEGSDCKTRSRDKFIGSYVGNETCTIGTDSYTITISANSDDIKVTMQNVYNQSLTAIGTMTGSNSFNFSGSDNTTKSTFSGSGSLSGNKITVTYQITSPLGNNSCTFIGDK